MSRRRRPRKDPPTASDMLTQAMQKVDWENMTWLLTRDRCEQISTSEHHDVWQENGNAWVEMETLAPYGRVGRVLDVEPTTMFHRSDLQTTLGPVTVYTERRGEAFELFERWRHTLEAQLRGWTEVRGVDPPVLERIQSWTAAFSRNVGATFAVTRLREARLLVTEWLGPPGVDGPPPRMSLYLSRIVDSIADVPLGVTFESRFRGYRDVVYLHPVVGRCSHPEHWADRSVALDCWLTYTPSELVQPEGG